MRFHLLSAGLGAALLASPLSAQTTVSSDGISEAPFDLGTLLLSGGLTPLRFGDYARAASVVTAEEIERRGIATVQEALTALPGLSVGGTSESLTQIRIRGGEGNHTLVLIDGIEAAGGDGEYFLSGLSTENVDRIEVLRGPQSVFYGSNASSGVVNIVTRTAETGTRYGGSVEFGDGTDASGYISSRDDRGGVALSVSRRDDDGYDISNSGGDEDGIRRDAIAIKGDYEVAPGLTFGVIARHVDGRYEYDATDGAAATADGYVVDADDVIDRDETTRSLWAEYEMLDGRLTHRLAWEKTDIDQQVEGGDRTETDTRAIEYVLSLGLDGRPVATTLHQLNLLVEDETDSASTEPGFERSNTSVAIEYRGNFGALDVQAGLRRDRNDPFEDQTTYTLAASYAVTEALRFHGSAGRGAVNPTYTELYYDQTFFGTRYLGNPDLEPEKNRSFDLGVELAFAGGRGLVDLTYFNETLRDEITIVPVSATLLSYENEEGESDREGVELAARWQVNDALSLSAAYTYLDAKNGDGSIEIRRPRNELGFAASYAFADDRAVISGSLRHVDGLFDDRFFGDFAQGVEIDSFTTVDVAARYTLTPQVALTARVENLFDEEYQEVLGYQQRGRTIHAGLAANF
ncbi:TonB-dependent receptor plug domain-containing protein [Palleronia sp. LCG004]|uniref:TonB-dependent receptor plug domain-containing protein n=1 Tax=Palleronia sp. LCG004 TaxID=3079304 RepID=UPI00294218C0|nr:TonB-dependent receptor [Palleronia sp. LCG004]WOI58373.1 TonB-dependent receptor [Palleronia sp. LCG004]